MLTAMDVCPVRLAKAEVGLRFRVNPDAVGAGDAATVPINACSRSLMLSATIGEALTLSVSASTRCPLPMWLASKAGGVPRLSLSERTANLVLLLMLTFTVVGALEESFEST